MQFHSSDAPLLTLCALSSCCRWWHPVGRASARVSRFVRTPHTDKGTAVWAYLDSLLATILEDLLDDLVFVVGAELGVEYVFGRGVVGPLCALSMNRMQFVSCFSLLILRSSCLFARGAASCSLPLLLERNRGKGRGT